MTRCSKDEANLKSSTYNQSGENFFQQLSAYNSMSAHLRRILLAKSVVDSRNKDYLSRKKQTCKLIDKPQFLKKDLMDELIDRLAYDTLHHPTDTLRMTFASKYQCQREAAKRCIDCYEDYNITCPRSKVHNHSLYEETDRRSSRGRPTSRTNKSLPSLSTSRQTIQREPFADSSVSHGKKIKSVDAKTMLKLQDELSERRTEEESLQGESVSDFLTHDTNRLSTLSDSSQNYEDREAIYKRERRITVQATAEAKDEEAKYTDFVYGITREIMNNGLYTDQELQEVFEKHLEKNKGILNMVRIFNSYKLPVLQSLDHSWNNNVYSSHQSKMLYEIYQLKISLNVSNDSDDDEEVDDFIHNQKSLNVMKIRPPTPPKILNENKVIEKLMSYQQIIDSKRRSSVSGTKSVVLVDANPQLLITEKDVLLSLMEANIEPNRAQEICRSLFHKSRDAFFAHTVQERDTKEESDEHISTEPIEGTQRKKQSSNDFEVNEREKSCVTIDLIPKENKHVQT